MVITLLLLLILCILIFILYQQKKLKNRKESFYYSFAALSQAEQTAIIIKKIQQGIDLYNTLKSYFPKLKKLFETVSDFNILKQEMCKWASQQQLLQGFIAIINKILNQTNLGNTVRNILTKIKNALLKLQANVAVAKIVSNLSSLIPGLPSAIKDGLNIFSNIDSNLVQLFKSIGVDICAAPSTSLNPIDDPKIKAATIPADAKLPDPPVPTISSTPTKEELSALTD